MTQWNVAAAQYGCHDGELDANIRHHLHFIRRAAREQVDLLVFPEYSLTGLSPCTESLNGLSFDSPALDVLQTAAMAHQMTVIVGLPLREAEQILPGAVGFMPDGSRMACHKPAGAWDGISDGAPIIGRQGRSFALGINSEGQDETWPRSAADQGADLYTTGRIVSEIAWQHEVMHLQRWSHKYRLPVLMANHAWSVNGTRTAGRSACWDERGQLIVRADEGELLVISRRSERGWQGEVIPLV
ncbi:carbon-nitrogen hydrolase family protein [Shimwellia pseudoproteus]|uniref:carbon-nitrogen hydrolase family protein n=1 Tax=Shimwellia pseudoproteus TaxID=570012 RepID=UPI0018EC7E77|nr:carbon-nitrogen hydrolase family protein [Shimwellia pseudoproteus]MBJ3813996.1 carbon-nitrogen hydrolase family protein [Shimwellia pseudoproteus]